MPLGPDRINDLPIGGGVILTPDVLQYERTAVDQPPDGGFAYPFVAAHALTPLLADAYLSYADDLGLAVPPLRVAWLHGFGLNPAPPPDGMPTPVHLREILIADAAGNTVFDSTEATNFGDLGWGARRIVQWETTTAVARVVFYEGQLPNFAAELAYSDAVLDARTCERLPLRLRSLRAGSGRLVGAVRVVAGYNVELAATAPAGGDGGRREATLTIGGVIGAGTGRKPGCESVDLTLGTINKIAPGADGNFVIQADGCYRAQRDLVVGPPGDGRTASLARPASLVLSNDCEPCCTCAEYADVYRALSALWDDWHTVGARAASVRDTYAANVARWNAQASCRAARALRAIAAQEPGCKTFVGALYCNASACCLAGVRLRFTVRRYRNGVLDGGSLADVTVPAAFVSGPGLTDDTPYGPRVTYTAGAAIVECFFEGADPQAALIAKLRLCADCAADQTLEATVTAHAAGSAPGCTPPAAAVPPAIAALWAAAGVDAVPTLAVEPVLAPLDPTPAPPPCECP